MLFQIDTRDAVTSLNCEWKQRRHVVRIFNVNKSTKTKTQKCGRKIVLQRYSLVVYFNWCY